MTLPSLDANPRERIRYFGGRYTDTAESCKGRACGRRARYRWWHGSLLLCARCMRARGYTIALPEYERVNPDLKLARKKRGA